jgi:hypothetical protein
MSLNGIKKRKFTLISKWDMFTFVTSSFQKLEQKIFS